VKTRDLLSNAADRLRAAGVDTPLLDVDLLLSRASNLSRAELLTRHDLELSPEIVTLFEEYVERRVRREPLHYILEHREFYKTDFELTPSVLIPRQETEILVETAIRLLQSAPQPKAIDIGVGSGVIAVSLAKAVSNSIIYGTDISHEAVQVAKRNAERTGVHDRTNFQHGNLFDPFPAEFFNLIVSNPPYIPTSVLDTLQPEVRDYEPRQALDGGLDGLDYYRKMAPEAMFRLRLQGALAVEIGYDQAEAVRDIFQSAGFEGVQSIKDHGGIERVVLGEKR